MHPQSTEQQSTQPTVTPGPSYFKAVADLQRAVHALMDANVADPYGYIAVVAAECGGLAAEQNKLAKSVPTEPAYMSCPRQCGVDVREHNSSDLVDGKCDTEPELRHRVAAELRRIADDILTQQLPVGDYTRLHLGVLSSRTDLERWATYLGSAIEFSGTDGDIPITQHTTQLVGQKYGPSLVVHTQIQPEGPCCPNHDTAPGGVHVCTEAGA